MSSQNGTESGENQEINSMYFEVRSSNDFGRYFIAKEDIDEKTLILCETPFIYGPTDDKDLGTGVVSLYCLACCKLLFSHRDQQLDNSLENVYYCSKCGWPVCDRICEMAPNHSDNECKFFSSLTISDNEQYSTYPPTHQWLMYKSMILLRLLLSIKRDRHYAWDTFLEKLEHHTKIRHRKPNCVKADEIVLENLGHFTRGLEAKRKSVSKKTAKKYTLPFLDDRSFLERLIGVFNVNAFCTENNVTKRSARCLFRLASICAHSCAPNSSWTVEISLSDTDNQKKANGKGRSKNETKDSQSANPHPTKITPQMQIYSSVPIKQGEMINIAYSASNLFFGTLKRQVCMESMGHFICKCVRCKDQTELGTMMSSIRCFDCDCGFLVPEDPSNQDSDWMCLSNSCDYSCSVGKVVYFITKIQDQIDRLRSKDLDWYEEQEWLECFFNKYYGNELHENHYLLHEMSTRMVDLFGSNLTLFESGKFFNKKERQRLLDRFLFHIRYMVRIANKIMPGYNNHQSQLQYYLEVAESLR